MHWPAPMTKDEEPDRTIDWLDTWKEMERLYKKHPEKLRAIGVSNFSEEYLKSLEQCDHRPGSQPDKTTSEFAFSDMISPLIYCSSCHQPELRDFCQKQGIVVTSYSPLGSDRSPLMTEPIVLRLAEKHSVTPATILISLQTSLPNTTVLPKSVTPERIKDNAEVIQLSEDEIKELVTLSDTSPYRACGPE